MPASAGPCVSNFAIHSIAGNTHFQETKWETPSKTSVSRPLRVIRVLDAGHAPANVGRMMISGRMADVCAELDRLVAREATTLH